MTIFFPNNPTFIEAPVVAQITVTRLLESDWKNDGGWFAKKYSFNVMARVERVIRGAIDKKLIKIVAPAADCTQPIAVGDSGFVAGELRPDKGGTTELHPIVESFDARWRREHFTPR